MWQAITRFQSPCSAIQSFSTSAIANGRLRLLRLDASSSKSPSVPSALPRRAGRNMRLHDFEPSSSSSGARSPATLFCVEATGREGATTRGIVRIGKFRDLHGIPLGLRPMAGAAIQEKPGIGMMGVSQKAAELAPVRRSGQNTSRQRTSLMTSVTARLWLINRYVSGSAA